MVIQTLSPDSAAPEQFPLLGQQMRAARKALRVSATAAAEAAGISRVTLHRIENGEPSVNMGAYLSLLAVLGLKLKIIEGKEQDKTAPAVDHAGWIPARICFDDYPQLRQLAWQVQGTDALTPTEALGIYERNWRHIDVAALSDNERQLIDALRLGLGEHTGHV